MECALLFVVSLLDTTFVRRFWHFEFRVMLVKSLSSVHSSAKCVADQSFMAVVASWPRWGGVDDFLKVSEPFSDSVYPLSDSSCHRGTIRDSKTTKGWK